MIRYPNKINLKKFEKSLTDPEIKFGLPREIKFCKKCVISNQRPNSTIEFKNTKKEKKKTINFDENDICDSCNYNLKKDKINWKERELELSELLNKYRKNNHEYDCIIPGSGGKDSFFTSHILKNKYKMNPLTVTWSPTIYTDYGWRNFSKWINSHWRKTDTSRTI